MTARPRVMTVYGTRPEAIKMAPLVAALEADDRLEPVVAVTGQHREMLDQVNALFGIRPAHDLDLMTPGASLAEITARTVLATSELLRADRPEVVVVQGDTTTVLATSLAAFYERIPVVHLEAGLRTGDIRSPFPEEANRRLTAPLADLHLAPTATSRANLLRESIPGSRVPVTGNTVIDALRWTTAQPVEFTDPAVAAFFDGPSAPRDLLLVTSHRRESWGAPMVATMTAVRDLAVARPDLQVLLPMHRNPVVREVIEPLLGHLDNVLLTEPLDYHQFAHALARATVVLTDSGGVQEEAPSLGKPVLVMRDTTERPEAVEAGTVRLVGTDGATIRRAVDELLDDPLAYAEMAGAVNPYGDGRAAERCVAAIAELLGVGERAADFAPAPDLVSV
ncbi:UDP-N-acetylglucosamine 2-epimerase [Humibacillus xanthopallidus]|uniref:UDP-N-acetylglucosamine 2-epimerase (non-hydrolyzing) n=1 Tax=Humibacillus xanthopallidus TaxID=412689 RepID=A0A543PP90_9MICO|nr:UDP-N-acetylglucosamine 2-epimerase (non-hydrolyzing) [Humibacillus xanthopallidus]TQN45891.1 UDP-N-acetylglucosamine 2-epimerase [Humibacillus xanthopallidus]